MVLFGSFHHKHGLNIENMNIHFLIILSDPKPLNKEKIQGKNDIKKQCLKPNTNMWQVKMLNGYEF